LVIDFLGDKQIMALQLLSRKLYDEVGKRLKEVKLFELGKTTKGYKEFAEKNKIQSLHKTVKVNGTDVYLLGGR